MKAIDPLEKLTLIKDYWHPRVVGEVNDCQVKVVRLKGEFVWHQHESEDELFFVLKGRLLMKFADRSEWVEKGQFLVVPRGVRHLPVADEEVLVMLIEPRTTVNTGEVRNELTREAPESI